MNDDDKKLIGDNWLVFGWENSENIGYKNYPNVLEEEEIKLIQRHNDAYDYKDNKIKIRIYNYKQYDEMKKYYKGNKQLYSIFNREFKDETQHYNKWLYRMEFGLPKNYQLKTVVPHPKDKNKLIHYYEYVTPHLTMQELQGALVKIVAYLIGVAVIVVLLIFIL